MASKINLKSKLFHLLLLFNSTLVNISNKTMDCVDDVSRCKSIDFIIASLNAYDKNKSISSYQQYIIV